MNRLSACLVLVLIMGAISAKTQQQPQRPQRQGTEKLFERLSNWRHNGLVSLVACQQRIVSYGSENVLASDDSGRTWSELSPELVQRTVADIQLSGDTITVASPSGVRNRTTNRGLTWQQILEQRQRPYVADSSIPISSPISTGGQSETITVRDTLVIFSRPSGIAVSYAHPMIRSASCATASYRFVYIGLGRSGIARIDRQDLAIGVQPEDLMSGAYVQRMCVAGDLLYVAVTHKFGEILRKPEYGSHWNMIPIDLLEDPPQVLCMMPTRSGVYIGLREQGLAYIDHTATIGKPLHLGLAKAGVSTVEPFGASILVGSSQRGPSLLSTCNGPLADLAKPLQHYITLATTSMGSALLVGCHDGSIHRSEDSGSTWHKIAQPVGPSVINRLQRFGDTLLLLTMNGVLRSLDTGRTWAPLHRGLAALNVKEVARVDTSDILQTHAGTFRLTRSGFLSEIQLPTTYEFRPFLSSVTSADGILYASGYPSFSMSLDGGRTWRCYLSDEMMTTRAVSVIGDHVLVATAEGVLYRIRRDAARAHLFKGS